MPRNARARFGAAAVAFLLPFIMSTLGGASAESDPCARLGGCGYVIPITFVTAPGATVLGQPLTGSQPATTTTAPRSTTAPPAIAPPTTTTPPTIIAPATPVPTLRAASPRAGAGYWMLG